MIANLKKYTIAEVTKGFTYNEFEGKGRTWRLLNQY